MKKVNHAQIFKSWKRKVWNLPDKYEDETRMFEPFSCRGVISTFYLCTSCCDPIVRKRAYWTEFTVWSAERMQKCILERWFKQSVVKPVQGIHWLLLKLLYRTMRPVAILVLLFCWEVNFWTYWLYSSEKFQEYWLIKRIRSSDWTNIVEQELAMGEAIVHECNQRNS